MDILGWILLKLDDVSEFFSPKTKSIKKRYKKLYETYVSGGMAVLAEIKTIPKEEFKKKGDKGLDFYTFIAHKSGHLYEILENITSDGTGPEHPFYSIYQIKKDGGLAYEENRSVQKIGIKEFLEELKTNFIAGGE